MLVVHDMVLLVLSLHQIFVLVLKLLYEKGWWGGSNLNISRLKCHEHKNQKNLCRYVNKLNDLLVCCFFYIKKSLTFDETMDL